MQISELLFFRGSRQIYPGKNKYLTMGLQPWDLWSDQSKDYSERVLRRLMAIRKMKEYGSTLNEKKGLFILFKEGVLAGAIFNELLNSALSMAMMGKKI